MDDKEAYGSLNMGAGFALYTDEVSAGIVLEFLNENEANGSYGGMVGGRIENSEQRKVIIQPKGIEFVAESLAIR
ncbi:MAG: hypothetical protein HYV68_03460 [Candidatus Taylorbacteria bacterium]|nr:hypothetical protein [Candidatus Taylorbacteria bacterium]